MDFFSWYKRRNEYSSSNTDLQRARSSETRSHSSSLDTVKNKLSEPENSSKGPPTGGYDDQNFAMLLKDSGIGCDSHEITTKDGYILKVFHLINQNYTPKKRLMLKPVLLQHGIVDSSDNWVINGDEDSLGIYLAKKEYFPPKLVTMCGSETTEETSIQLNMPTPKSRLKSTGTFLSRKWLSLIYRPW